MAAALGAIKGLFRLITNNPAPTGSPRHIATILDVLEPQSPRG